jgi:dipeptidyl aminopeptidase/acylaminoacyl peptidase
VSTVVSRSVSRSRVAAAAAVFAALAAGCATRPAFSGVDPGPVEDVARDEGQVLSAEPCELGLRYPELTPLDRAEFPRAEYDAAKRALRERCLSVRYSSEGLAISGFVFRPAGVRAGDRYPAIIYNRGGNRDFGKVGTWDLLLFHRWSNRGFVVFASQYRGSDGAGGLDEFGGGEVHDVFSLIALARQNGYTDPDNLFMFGLSRGGIMTYQALRRGAPVRAAAVVAGVTDLEDLAVSRPEFFQMWDEMDPAFRDAPRDFMEERSALEWPESLRTPLLLLHSEDDRSVPSEQSVRLAEALRAEGATVELVLYPGDAHVLQRYGRDRDERVLDWFCRYNAGRPCNPVS